MEFPNCNLYEGGELPPCSAFLNNANPIIKDGKVIFRNENRLFYFINTTSANSSAENGADSAAGAASLITNLQISLPTYIVGLFINQVQLNEIPYDKDCTIHSDQTVNTFIHESLQNPPELKVDFLPALSLVISNGNAILTPFTYTLNISPLNYFILFFINRLEGNPGLVFVNNSFATEDLLNFLLAELNFQFPCPE
ncbi:MAG: hypothetical protein ACOWWO_02385 [Peptococcaceae bacterium]